MVPRPSIMQRLNPSPELTGSNQRSVIAKSVSNQIVSVDAVLPAEIYEPTENLKDGDSAHQYPCIDSTPPTRTQAVLGNCNYANSYELYCGYELMKAKRKPIPVPSESKDDAYWERRRRNNESAKRSREIRRLKETQTNKRIMYLEQENVKLQTEVGFLREEIRRLRNENELLPYLVRRCK